MTEDETAIENNGLTSSGAESLARPESSSSSNASNWISWTVVVVLSVVVSISVGRLFQFPIRSFSRLVDGSLAWVVMLTWFAAGFALVMRQRPLFWTKWWDPSRVPDGPISWGDVQRLVCDDPLEHVPTFRWHFFLYRLSLHVLFGSLFLSLGWLLLCYIDEPWIPSFLIKGTPEAEVFGTLISPNQNLTAYLALVAASISIVFTYVQLRAKVRADNRQAWINRARTHLRVVTSLGSLHSYADESEAGKLWRRFAPLRLELELMLNPSEKDHRLLSFLLYELAVFREPIETREQIADSERLKRVVKRKTGESFDSWLPNSQVPVQLITYILRLAHVVLKREWERVKHTR